MSGQNTGPQIPTTHFDVRRHFIFGENLKKNEVELTGKAVNSKV